MVSATYVLEVDWDGSGTFDGGDEDLTADFTGEATFDMGRTGPSTLTNLSRAGKFEAVLRNNDDKYNSFNSSSAIFGDILPGRKVRLTTSSPSSATLWTGYLERIEPLYGHQDSSGRKKAKLTALGSLSQLSDAQVDISMQENQATGTLVGDVLDAADWASADRDIDTGQTTVTRYWTSSERNALNAIRELELTEAGFIRETPDGKIAFESRRHRQLGPHTEPQIVMSDGTGGGVWGTDTWGNFTWGNDFAYESIEQLDPLDLVRNEMKARVQLYTVQSIATLWTHPEANATGDAPEIAPGVTVTYWANYPNPASATNAVAVDEWTTPVATTDYTANSANDGTGTDLTGNLNVTATKFANSMKLEIENTGSVTAFLTSLKARGTAIHVSDAVTVEAEDSSSQTTYGLRSFQRPEQAKWIPSTLEAQNWADVHLELFKDAVPVIVLTYLANKSTLHLTEMLTRQVSDRITVAADSGVGFGFNQDFFVERIQHRISDYGQVHKVTYLLNSAGPLDEFWILGVSELGTGTRANY